MFVLHRVTKTPFQLCDFFEIPWKTTEVEVETWSEPWAMNHVYRGDKSSKNHNSQSMIHQINSKSRREEKKKTRRNGRKREQNETNSNEFTWHTHTQCWRVIRIDRMWATKSKCERRNRDSRKFYYSFSFICLSFVCLCYIYVIYMRHVAFSHVSTHIVCICVCVARLYVPMWPWLACVHASLMAFCSCLFCLLSYLFINIYTYIHTFFQHRFWICLCHYCFRSHSILNVKRLKIALWITITIWYMRRGKSIRCPKTEWDRNRREMRFGITTSKWYYLVIG